MDTVKTFIVILMSAVSNCLLYSRHHASVLELTEKAFSLLNVYLQGTEHLEIMILEDELVVNRSPLREVGLQGKNLMKRLKRKGVTRIDFLKGVSLSELRQLVANIASAEKGLKSLPHIQVGVVDIDFDRSHVSGDFSADRSSDMVSGQIEKVQGQYHAVSPFRQLNIAGFEEIVVQFVLTLQKDMGILHLLSPVRSMSEYHAAHSANVSVLTMFQAQAIGIREEFIHDIGLAALLHDVGKLLMQKEKEGQTEADTGIEENAIELHTIYGAQYLAKTDGLTRLAPIVAFEHHLRYDGRGYPQCKTQGMKQHLCSQITAIADYFDTLMSAKPDGRTIEMDEALYLMRTKDEGLFNPFLINNFVRSMHLALSR